MLVVIIPSGGVPKNDLIGGIVALNAANFS